MKQSRAPEPSRRRSAAIAVGCLLALVLGGLLTGSSGVASAADTTTTCDPVYGCPTTQPPPPPEASCSLDVQSARVGQTVTATVTNAAPGVQIEATFNGEVVGSAVTDANGNATIKFTVPDVPEGSYQVFAVGAGVSAQCSLDPGFAVLAASTGGGGGGGLAMTGSDVLILLLVALVLLIAGRAALVASHRRRRARRRSRPHVTTGA